MEGRSWVCLLSPCLGYCPAWFSSSLSHAPTAQAHRFQLWSGDPALDPGNHHCCCSSLDYLSVPPSISWITISLNYFLSWKHLKGFLLSSLYPDWYTDQAVGPRGPCGSLWSWAETAKWWLGSMSKTTCWLQTSVWPDKKCFGKETCFSFLRFTAMRWVKWTQLVS